MNLNNSRLVCIAPAQLQTGPQRMKISILRNHTSMSQEICVVNQNDSDFWQTDGTPDYLLVNQSKCWGIQGRNNNFSGNCTVLKPVRVGFFFPLIPSFLAPLYTIGWTNNFCCIVLQCAQGGNGWYSQETWSKGRQQFVVAGCGNCCWSFLFFPTLAPIRFYPRTAFAFM